MSLDELRHRPLVFVDDLEAPALTEADRHHLERSLRFRYGSVLTVGDGRGRWRAVRFGAELGVDGPIESAARSGDPVTIAFAVVKGDRSDLAVQKLTELGVTTIVPLVTERSVVRWDEARAAKNRERHRRIAREAAMQSRRLWLPAVEPLTTLDRFLVDRPDAVLADPGGRPVRADDRTIVVGPEGGFSAGELASRPMIRLPGGVLRTETAAIAAAVTVLARSESRSDGSRHLPVL